MSLAVRATDANPLTVIIDGSLVAGSDGLYQVTMSYADGAKNVTARAVDAAGNTSTAARSFMVDTTPPEVFPVTVEPPGWTDDTTPVLTFAAIDATSGIARYEVSVDAGPGVAATSPFTIGPLADGVHSIEVTAVDRADNTQTVGAAARIDTVAPPAPAFFRGIEGPDQVELVWEPPADDVVSYRIEPNPSLGGWTGDRDRTQLPRRWAGCRRELRILHRSGGPGGAHESSRDGQLRRGNREDRCGGHASRESSSSSRISSCSSPKSPSPRGHERSP